jgi:hypothetical protein
MVYVKSIPFQKAAATGGSGEGSCIRPAWTIVHPKDKFPAIPAFPFNCFTWSLPGMECAPPHYSDGKVKVATSTFLAFLFE